MNTFWKAITLSCVTLGAGFAESLCGAATVTFAKTNLITLNDPGQPFAIATATPYPSTLNVSGFLPSDRIQKVTVTLHNLRHSVYDDLDMMLVSPSGTNLVFFSDAGGGFSDGDVPITLTFDDDAASEVQDDGPNTGSLASGTYRPSNFEGSESFPGAAPSQSSATNLAVFAGISPNGNWQLYIVDDEVFDSGSISNGWSLTIRTVAASPQMKISRTGTNVIVRWPTNATGFTLQSTTNLVSPILWTTNTPAPVIVGGENTVTNVGVGARKFYRLIQ